MWIVHVRTRTRHQPWAYMGMEWLPGQRHRCGLEWVGKRLWYEGSQVRLRGATPFFPVSISNEIGYKQKMYKY